MTDKVSDTPDYKILTAEIAVDAPAAGAPPGAAPGKVLSPAALRALEEAAARREANGDSDAHPVEHNGPSGEEPTRFGDWERKGITYDF